jgi:hypothetical protein
MEMAMSQQTKQRPMASDQKTCTKCGEPKPFDGFYRDKRNPDGLRPDCKECTGAVNAKWRAENREHYRALCRAYYRKNRSRTLAALRERYANDPEFRARDLEASRQWRKQNPERKHEHDRERVAKRSSRVRRIRKLIDHFEGRGAYLDYIAHAIDRRSDAQGLQWLCSRIDALVAERVYGEV